MQQHGFARNLDWEISTSSADLQPDDKDPSVELILTDNDYTRSMWCASGPLIFPCACFPHVTQPEVFRLHRASCRTQGDTKSEQAHGIHQYRRNLAQHQSRPKSHALVLWLATFGEKCG